MSDYKDFFRALKEQFEAITKQFKELNIEESLKSMEKVAIHGAEQGWTIPPHTTMRESQELIQGKSKTEMDKQFEEHYLIEGNYSEMKADLLSNVFQGKWKELLEECFYNYENGRFKITIPCLFSILEGAVFDIVKDQQWKKAFSEEIKQIEDGSISKPIFLSVRTFIIKAFSFGKFDDPNYKPSLLNRNWVLHGRDNISEWQRVDSLRLFNALYSLTFLDFNTHSKND